MHAWEAIQQSVDTIERNLGESLTTETLAASVHLSPFYFQRLFRRLVHAPVGEYIRLRRLAHAAKRLEAGDGKIVDIALAAGYESHEGFTRAFKAAYGVTPEGHRKSPQVLNHFEKPEIALQYTLLDEGVPLLVGNVVLEIGRRTLDAPLLYAGVVGEISIEGQIPPGEATGVSGPAAIWQRLEKTPGLHTATGRLGASFFGNAGPGHFSYFAGVQVNEVPPGLDTFRLGAGHYVVCLVEAESRDKLVNAALDEGLKYLLYTWLPGHGIEIHPYSAEQYLPERDGVHALELWVQVLEK